MAEQSWSPQRGGKQWWSKSILTGAVLSIALLPIGALGARFGLWSYGTGFMLLALGTMMSSVVLVTGIAGIVVAKRRNHLPDRPPLYFSVVLAGLVLALMAVQFYRATTVPPIHNVSTDTVDPPQFDRVVELRGADANPLGYPAEEVAPLQRQAYPWVDTLRTELAPDQALERAASVLEDQGLEVVNVDPSAGRVEATDTTFWFGFKDDLVVRVRPAAGGSFVDVRSVSRVGRSDLGANAQRIGEFLDAFAER